MFTGIVQGLVAVSDIAHLGDISRLRLDLGQLSHGVEVGGSIAVNGTCLTVTAAEQGLVNFDVIKETLNNTNLVKLKRSNRVNVERSCKVGDEIGGHVVSGHVIGVSRLIRHTVDGFDHIMRFDIDAAWQDYVFLKGFIAVDGASLTISGLNRDEAWFEVSLIPETLARTTMGIISEGELVNIEVEAQTVTTVETIKRLFADSDWLSDLVPR